MLMKFHSGMMRSTSLAAMRTVHIRKNSFKKVEKMVSLYIKYETKGGKCSCNVVLKNKVLKMVSR